MAYVYQDVWIAAGSGKSSAPEPSDILSAIEPTKSKPNVPVSWAKDDIDKAISLKLIPEAMQNSYESNITREEFCNALIFVVIQKNEALADKAYAEMKPAFSDTKNANVGVLHQLGVVSGVGDGKFNPNGLITRQEAAVMLQRTAKALGSDITGIATNFDDKNKIASWANEGVSYVFAKDIMSGTGNNQFSPLGMYTRQQAYVTILRIYNAL